MKKQGLLRRFGLSAIIVLLCLAMMITCISFVIPSIGTPFAETNVIKSATATRVEVLKDVKIKKNVKYGEKINVPATDDYDVTVTAPNGKTVEMASGGVVANQVGNYKITYSKNDVSYDFYVRVTLKEDYFLNVAYDGADIPTYIQVGGKIVLPEATVSYYDEDNILRDYEDVGGAYSVEVSTSRGDKINDVKAYEGDSKIPEADRTIDVGNTVGKMFITYTARLEENGAKYFSQTFTVNVQTKVPGTGNPTLSVSGVQKDVSVNRAVTLPKATATDSYDNNVKVEISVTYDGKPVQTVDIDENGYAYQDADKTYKAVKFDNNKSMTFYPLEKGSYKVTYTAYSDAYEGGSVGKSSTREYYITVSDLAAPVFKSVREDTIPEKWGMTVEKAGEGEDAEVVEELGGKITFYVPEVVDNLDHMYPTDSDDKNLISVYFRIMDADNSKTVIEFTNILAEDVEKDGEKVPADACSYKAKDNSAYTVDAVFNKDNPFVFNLENYNKVDKNGDPEKSKAGTYTVLYRARDKANNTSSKTYSIEISETYTDKNAPTKAEVVVPDYISAADETLNIPYAVYADGNDTRPTVDYRIYTDAKLSDGDVRFIEVDGGEIADLVDGYLVINSGKANEKKLLLGDNLYFYVGVADKVGNFTSNVEGNVNLTEFDNNAESVAYKDTKAKITVIATESGKFTYSEIDNGGMQFAVNYKNVEGASVPMEIAQGDTVVASGFSIETASLDMRNYTGFEVAVYDPLGDPVDVTLETMSAPDNDNDKATIYVQNISFRVSLDTMNEDGTANDAGKYYTVVVRVFDVNGNNEVYGYKLTGIKKAESSHVKPSAVNVIGNSGDVNVSYKLHNVDPDLLGAQTGTYYIVRKISGLSFSLMGNEFTAKKAGGYAFRDGYINATALNNDEFAYFDYSDVKPIGSDNGGYTCQVSDTSSPIIEVQGVIPTYKDFDKTTEDGNEVSTGKTTVELPSIVAYTENGMAVVDIEVTGPDNKTVKFDKETNSFEATKDGSYEITVTATSANAQSTKAKYYVNIGDIVGPEFTVSKTTYATMKVGDTFSFADMKLENDESGVTITKKLIDPSHEEVSDATVSGSYSTYGSKGNNGTDITLSMAGTYEIVYTAKDSVGNETAQRYTVTVVSSGTSTPTTWTTLSTVLIVVAVVLLAGVIVYVVRFRKVKK